MTTINERILALTAEATERRQHQPLLGRRGILLGSVASLAVMLAPSAPCFHLVTRRRDGSKLWSCVRCGDAFEAGRLLGSGRFDLYDCGADAGRRCIVEDRRPKHAGAELFECIRCERIWTPESLTTADTWWPAEWMPWIGSAEDAFSRNRKVRLGSPGGVA
jgi:uncharacterized C2H2 Zn-finger protein